MKHTYFVTCPFCGSHLDPGERCNCQNESEVKMKTENEWQSSEKGKRYRKIGDCIEYEPEINGVPESVFFASQKLQQEQRKKELEEERRRAIERAQQCRNCPFVDADSLNTACVREGCAIFMDDGCVLARVTSAKDTKGLQCPLNKYHGKCRSDCALYRNGCAFTGITTERKQV